MRFISLNCNCPCYIPRPKLRFTIRIGFHLFCIILRITAVIAYDIMYDLSSDPAKRELLHFLLLITGMCLIFPFLTILLDVYHYRVWWAYKPDIDLPPDIAGKPFSSKHKRFIPYVLTERFRTNTIGNRQCKYGNNCQSPELEHVVIFHSSDYRPQPRWSENHPVYIGFHRTTPEAAFRIAMSEFRPSAGGMLGPGAYFARSTAETMGKIGKATQTGAWFVAEIRMGNVFEVDESLIRQTPNNSSYDYDLHRYVHDGEWSKKYDTCYFRHSTESKDEYCIKDPATQILRWVVVVEAPHDRKIYSYGLATEINSAACGCI